MDKQYRHLSVEERAVIMIERSVDMGLKLFSWVVLVCSIISCASAVASTVADAGSVGRLSGPVIEFSTNEFTQPSIEVRRDGKALYFDVLGEMFTVPIDGGLAKQIDLGAGWKERPMLSPDGTKLAFLSDRNGTIGLWVKLLDSVEGPIPYDIRDNADVMSASWVSNSELMTSGRGLYGAASFSLLTVSEKKLKSVSVDVSRVRHAGSMTSSNDGRYVYLLRNGLARLDRVSATESRIDGLPARASQLRIAPDGVHLGFVPASIMSPVGDDPTFSLFNIKTGAITRTNCTMERNFSAARDGAVSATYAFMPDGGSIVLGRGGLIRRCFLDGSTSTIPIVADVRVATAPRVRWHARQIGNQLRFLASAPSGGQLAFSARGRIWLLDIHDGSVERLTNGPDLEYMPSYSPDGTEIAYVALGSNGGSTLRIRSINSGVERAVISTVHVLANPTWSPDGHRLAFVEAPPNMSLRDAGAVELQWIDIFTGQRGTFAKNLYPFHNANRYYPTLSWNREGDGIFYSTYQEAPSGRYFKHQLIGQDPKVIYGSDWSVWDVSISPSGRYVAFMDQGGISVAPAAGSNVEGLVFDRARVLDMKRVTDSVADYMTWLPDDRLAWSVQDEVFISDSEFDQQKNLKITVPATKRSPWKGRVAYVGARVITMTDNQVIEDGVVITIGSLIDYVGPIKNAPLENAEIVDVMGKTIIPGIIDVHQHEEAINRDVTPELSHRLFTSAAYGVTTAFDPSLADIDGSILRERSAEDGYIGAALYTSGSPLLGPTGNPSYTRVDSYEDAVKFMRRKAQAGSVVAKDYLQPSRNQRRWLAEAARTLGLGLTGHERNDIRTQMTMVVDGYTGLEHSLFLGSGRLYGDIQRFLVTSGISMTPTLADDAYGMWAGIYFYRTNPPDDMYFRCLTSDVDMAILARPREFIVGKDFHESATFDAAKQYAQMLNDGGFVTIGSHNMPEGIGTHWEMWLLNMAGATPMNVLRAATINGAVKLGLESRIGSIDVGMDADFVVLNSNPLDDIKNTADISRVVRRGRSLRWPAQNHQPTTWTAKASWVECKKWNLGLPPPITPTSNHTSQR